MHAIETWIRKVAKPLYFYYLNGRRLYSFHVRMRNSLRKKEAILIHTMGKVGSFSVWRSLEAWGLDRPIYHTHGLSDENFKKLWKEKVRLHARPIPRHLLVSKSLRKVLDNEGLSNRKWTLITLVRDPIAVTISAFFQIIDYYIPNFCHQYNAANIKIEEVIEVFMNNFPLHDWALNWFDLEIKSVFGIDVFSSDFPKSKGYKVFRDNSVDLLLLRLENLNECAPNAFSEFLGIEQFIIKNANMAKDKDYYDAYNRFKDAIVFPDDYLERIYTHKYTRHFYSEDEISMFRLKWS